MPPLWSDPPGCASPGDIGRADAWVEWRRRSRGIVGPRCPTPTLISWNSPTLLPNSLTQHPPFCIQLRHSRAPSWLRRPRVRTRRARPGLGCSPKGLLRGDPTSSVPRHFAWAEGCFVHYGESSLPGWVLCWEFASNLWISKKGVVRDRSRWCAESVPGADQAPLPSSCETSGRAQYSMATLAARSVITQATASGRGADVPGIAPRNEESWL